jgi:hypothetical protein
MSPKKELAYSIQEYTISTDDIVILTEYNHQVKIPLGFFLLLFLLSAYA